MTTRKKRSVHTDNDSWVVIAPGTFTKFALFHAAHMYFQKSCIHSFQCTFYFTEALFLQQMIKYALLM